eukprot:gene2233-2544_t
MAEESIPEHQADHVEFWYDGKFMERQGETWFRRKSGAEEKHFGHFQVKLLGSITGNYEGKEGHWLAKIACKSGSRIGQEMDEAINKSLQDVLELDIDLLATNESGDATPQDEDEMTQDKADEEQNDENTQNNDSQPLVSFSPAMYLVAFVTPKSQC